MGSAPLMTVRAQGFDVTTAAFFEAPGDDLAQLEVWGYTDRISYRPGESVCLHAATTAEAMHVRIWRDGAEPRQVWEQRGVKAEKPVLPPDFEAQGCGWPVVSRWPIPADMPSGFYIVEFLATRATGEVRRSEHGFAVVAERGRARALLVLATSTWAAYNDWGGYNSYYSPRGTPELPFAPRLSLHRPMAKGLLSLPPGAPRKAQSLNEPAPTLPRYPPIEFAYARGLSKWYANAGWASYERHFAVWAARNGYALDIATQHDLHFDPGLLADYRCLITVGHDEYWSAEMRDAVDAFVDRGGNFARFGANIGWKIRLEDDGRTQVCFKDRSSALDPVHARTPELCTEFWDHPVLGRPAASTFGVSGAYGVYAGVGNLVARGPGGFTVYRPDHWSLAGTDLGYGDLLGAAATVFGYEVDGLDYGFSHGLPYPAPGSGAPAGLQIVAMGLAANTEKLPQIEGAVSYYGDSAPWLASVRYGRADADALAAASRGSGMIVSFERNGGQVFCAGSCEWVNGLARGDHGTERVTRNVLDRFLA